MAYQDKYITGLRSTYLDLSIVLLGVLTFTGHAQTYSGGLRGSITDPSGATIPGASITLTDESTDQEEFCSQVSTATAGTLARSLF